ncbi:MAG: PKD domain-containing protein [Bacteroidota bacterium]
MPTAWANGDCQADFTFEANGLDIQFQLTSTSSAPFVASRWTFGDGQSSSRRSPSHRYRQVGTYKVCHTIWDDNGCSDSRCSELTIDLNCQADFSFQSDTSQEAAAERRLFFSDQSTAIGDSIIAWDWQFESNLAAGSKEPSPTWTYSRWGQHFTCLNIKTALGCESESCQTINLEEATSSNVLKVLQLKIYPNPADDFASLSIIFNQSTDLTIELLDLLGHRLFLTQLNDQQALLQPLDLKQYSEGLYLVRVRAKNWTESLRLTKARKD